MAKLLDELKRRKVFRVAAVYAVVAWLLIEVTSTILPTFDAPAWVNQTVTFLLILGFPIALIFSWAYEVTPEGVKPDSMALPQAAVSPSADRKLIYAIFVLVAIVAGFQISDRILGNDLLTTASVTNSTNPSVMRSQITLDELLTRRYTGVRAQVGVSPDGAYLVYGDMPLDGQFRMLIRDLSSGDTKVLTDQISLGTIPEFSPDGQKVLLNANPDLLIAPTFGGPAEIIPVLNNLFSSSGSASTWLSNEEVLYVGNSNDGTAIYRKSLLDGTEELLVESDRLVRYDKPYALPGSEAILYSSRENSAAAANFNESNIELFNLRSNTADILIRGGYLARYAPSGHIVFLRSGDLWAVPFDLNSLEITGSEVMIESGIDSQSVIGISSFAFSNSGRLVFLPGPEIAAIGRPLTWIDRSGNEEEVPLTANNANQLNISPDGQTLALTVNQNNGVSDIWTYDFSRDSLTRLTFSEDASLPTWNLDSTKIAYFRQNGGIWLTSANGAGQAELIYDALNAVPNSFAADGSLIFGEGPSSGRNVNKLTYQDSTWVSSTLIENDFNKYAAKISPDGRWIAYTSKESGRDEVFVNSYPDTEEGKWQVSTRGGTEPIWGKNNNELFYLFRGRVVAVSFSTGLEKSFQISDSQVLLPEFYVNGFRPPNFAVSQDGQRFIGFKKLEGELPTSDVAEPATFIVIENWFEELKRLAPPDPR